MKFPKLLFFFPLVLASSVASVACTSPADEAGDDDEPSSDVASAQSVCPFVVDDRIPPGDQHGVVIFDGARCGSQLKLTYTGTNASVIIVDAWSDWGARWGQMRLERSGSGYRARFTGGDFTVVQRVMKQVDVAKANRAVTPKPGTQTNWNCIGAALSLVGGVAASIGACGVPVVNLFACGGAIVATAGAGAWALDACN